MRKDILLILPAYNEGANIGRVIDMLRENNVFNKMDVLIINDGSADNTEEVVRKKGVDIISQVYNLGYGATLQTGYKYADEKGYQYLLQMDADGQHDVKNLDRIIDKLIKNNKNSKKVNIVIGTRFLKGSESFYISKLKLSAIKLFRYVIKISTGYILTDPTSGLMGLDRSAFSYYAKYMHFDTKYPDLNMIVQMILLGYHIEEIPAIMHKREQGQSMHDGILNVGKYMLVMSLSTFNAYIRFRKIDKKIG